MWILIVTITKTFYRNSVIVFEIFQDILILGLKHDNRAGKKEKRDSPVDTGTYSLISFLCTVLDSASRPALPAPRGGVRQPLQPRPSQRQPRHRAGGGGARLPGPHGEPVQRHPPQRHAPPARPGRVGKNPGLKKNQPSGFFGFFYVFFYIYLSRESC
jgi:hypothetical protein